MAGFIIPIKGASSPPANTIYFGAVPDRLTMMTPCTSGSTMGFPQFSSGSTAFSIATYNNAALLKQWFNVNTSLGASITAPDGSTNAQHITESSDVSNTFHYVMAAVQCADAFQIVSDASVLRFAVFAMPAERTRISLQIITDDFQSGCRTVFDLAGGQIAQSGESINNSGFRTAWIPVQDSIVAWGDGWYLCSIDVAVTSVGQYGFTAGVVLDAGSGTAAEDTDYKGDGTSGVYLWTSSVLPAGAWGINNVQFFDDFDDSSTFDLNQTNEPGFNWYFPLFGSSGYNQSYPAIPSGITISDSILSIPASATTANPPNLSNTNLMFSAGWNGTEIVYGWFVRPPVYMEFKKNCGAASGAGQPTQPSGGDYSTFFPSAANLVASSQYQYDAVEFDIAAIQANVFTNPIPTTLLGIATPTSEGSSGSSNHIIGFPIWNAQWQYQNAIVWYAGVLYITDQEPTVGISPPDNSEQWSILVWADYDDAPPYTEPPPAIDLSQQHIYGTLWHPYIDASDVGNVLLFFDGNYIPNSWMRYTPDSGFQPADNANMILCLDGPTAPSNVTPFELDYVRITGT